MLLGAAVARAAPRIEVAAPALRRACATGALTPSPCAQRGVGRPAAAAGPPAPLPAVQAPEAALEAAAAPAATPSGATPERVEPHGPRRRAVVAAVRPFQDTKTRYHLEIPDGWELRMQGGFAAFAHGDAWIQLRASGAPTAETAARGGVDLLRGQYVDFHVGQDGPVQVGGRAGRRIVLSARTKAGRPSSLVVVAAPMAAGDHLVIVAGGGPGDAEVIQAGVASIGRTLRFR